MREGLKQILAGCADMRVAGEACDGDDVLRKLRQQKWDVVVLDMSMPGRSGLDLIKLIKAEKPGCLSWCSACTRKTSMPCAL